MDDGYLIQPSFQSTHPVWGGTMAKLLTLMLILFQSTHPVWGGTQIADAIRASSGISIHPPRVGWDINYLTTNTANSHISIHPPRVGWD